MSSSLHHAVPGESQATVRGRQGLAPGTVPEPQRLRGAGEGLVHTGGLLHPWLPLVLLGVSPVLYTLLEI